MYTGSTLLQSANPANCRADHGQDMVEHGDKKCCFRALSVDLTERLEEELEGLALVPLDGGPDLQHLLQGKNPMTGKRLSDPWQRRHLTN
jgi:hypothetical protein